MFMGKLKQGMHANYIVCNSGRNKTFLSLELYPLGTEELGF